MPKKNFKYTKTLKTFTFTDNILLNCKFQLTENLIFLFKIEKWIYYLKSQFLGQSIDRGSFPDPEGPGQHGGVTESVPLPLTVTV